jgi:nitrate/TMAO reductase-like tetraheme cytochrome c subunit
MSKEIGSSFVKGRIARFWAFLWRPSTRFALATLLIAGGIGGIVLWGGFNWAMEASNTEAFCISCHEMRDTVYRELKETVHYKNRSGVRAICSDCHVPHQWLYKVKRKIEASRELFYKATGAINTPEKFEAKRQELAENVWAVMKATDSRECRNCHSAESMDPAKQTAASQVMQGAMQAGMTCIDCHKGIAHHLPK